MNRSRHSWQYEKRCFLSSLLIRGGSIRKCVMTLHLNAKLNGNANNATKFVLKSTSFHPPFLIRIFFQKHHPSEGPGRVILRCISANARAMLDAMKHKHAAALGRLGGPARAQKSYLQSGDKRSQETPQISDGIGCQHFHLCLLDVKQSYYILHF